MSLILEIYQEDDLIYKVDLLTRSQRCIMTITKPFTKYHLKIDGEFVDWVISDRCSILGFITNLDDEHRLTLDGV